MCSRLSSSSSFITPEGSKIIQIKHLKHKITQQYTSKDDKKTPLKHHIKVQIITDEAKLHHTEGSQIIQIKHKITQHYILEKLINTKASHQSDAFCVLSVFLVCNVV